MKDVFANYDSWLEAPYQESMSASDAYYDWCDVQGLDPEESESEDAYEDFLSTQYDYDDDDDYYDEEDWVDGFEEDWDLE